MHPRVGKLFIIFVFIQILTILKIYYSKKGSLWQAYIMTPYIY